MNILLPPRVTHVVPLFSLLRCSPALGHQWEERTELNVKGCVPGMVPGMDSRVALGVLLGMSPVAGPAVV